MTSNRESKPLLTVGDVIAWKEERERVHAQISELQQTLDDLDKRLAFVDLFLTPSQKLDLMASTAAEDAIPDQNLTAFIKHTLKEAGRGMNLKEIGEVVKNSVFADRYSRNANSLYNSVSRLTDREEIVRVGNFRFDKEIYDFMKQQGIDPMANIESIPKKNTPQIIAMIVRSHPEGISTANILRELRTFPDMLEKLDRNPQYGYTVLSRMTKRGQITRVEDLYFPGSLMGSDDEESQADPFE